MSIFFKKHIKYMMGTSDKWLNKQSPLGLGRMARGGKTHISVNNFFFFFFLFFVTGFFLVALAGLELRNPPVSASWVLGLKACATTPSSVNNLISSNFVKDSKIFLCFNEVMDSMFTQLVLGFMLVPYLHTFLYSEDTYTLTSVLRVTTLS